MLSCSDRAGGARASRGLVIVPGTFRQMIAMLVLLLVPRLSLLSNLFDKYPDALVSCVSSPGVLPDTRNPLTISESSETSVRTVTVHAS
jgi:hypothetical protein